MTDPANDIFLQASQGSVAAIIQVLNDRLSDCGVRTRAIFQNGVLQILCEAATPEQMDAATLPERIRKILEAIAPRNIRRVNINSRIVREQQLLWLEEISRDPDGQLLWSKEILLKQPGLMQRFLRDFQNLRFHQAHNGLGAVSPRQQQAQKQLVRGGLIGAATVLLVGAGVWAVVTQLLTEPQPSTSEPFASAPVPPESQAMASPQPVPPSPTTAQPRPSATPTTTQAIVATKDPFVQAVRIAEQAAEAGKQANSAAAWLEIAARWRQASDLMAAVPESDRRYALAQDRVATYLRNSEAALQNAQ